MNKNSLTPSTDINNDSPEELPVRSREEYITYADPDYASRATESHDLLLNEILGLSVAIYMMFNTTGVDGGTTDALRDIKSSKIDDFNKLNEYNFICTENY